MLELAYRVLYLVRTDNNQLVKRTRKNTPARAHFSASPTPPPRGFPPTRPALSRKGSALHSCVAGQRARAVARTVSLAKRALRRSCLSVGPSGSRRPFLSLGLCGWLSTRRSPSQRLEPRVRQAVVPAEWRVAAAPIVNSRFPFTNQSSKSTMQKKCRLLARTRGDDRAPIQTCDPFTASGIDFSLLCFQPGAVHQFLTTSSQLPAGKNTSESL